MQKVCINTDSNYNINMAGIMKAETTDIWQKLQALELQMRNAFQKREQVAQGNQAALQGPQAQTEQGSQAGERSWGSSPGQTPSGWEAAAETLSGHLSHVRLQPLCLAGGTQDGGLNTEAFRDI